MDRADSHSSPAPNAEREPHVSTRFVVRVLATVAIVALVFGCLYLLSKVVQVLFFIFGGILFALFLRGLSEFVARHTGLWPRVSLTLVVLFLLGLLVGVGFFIGPQLVSQGQMLAQKLPESFDHARNELAHYSLTRPVVHALPSANQLSTESRKVIYGLPQIFSATTEAMALVLLSIFVGLYAAADPRFYLESLLHLLPPRARGRARQVGSRLHRALGWWLVGRVITMSLMGLLTVLGLWILKMPMVLPLGLISGLFQFVPYLGAFAAAAPAVLIGFVQSPTKALEVAGLYLIIHSLEGYFVTPIVQQRAVAIPPAALISVQLIMAGLFGLTGVIFATPIAVAVIVLVQTLYLHDVLKDQVQVLGQ